MLQAMMAKKVVDIILKKVMQKREITKLRKYVEEDNELDLQAKAHAKALDKYGRYIEELEKDVAILKASSHTPVFRSDDYKDILKRLNKLEKGRKK